MQIITTQDGSHSLFNKVLDETYHSIHGAIQESQHVFINNGLGYFKDHTNKSDIHILELGFGTGLNALLTMMHDHKKNIHYTTLEAFPLQQEIWSLLNYGDKLNNKEYYKSLHRCEWEVWHRLKQNFSFIKINNTLQQVSLPQSQYDLVYFDAFAPGKQPEMWSIEMLRKVVESMQPNAVFVTYCAKGQLKRDLKNLGLKIEMLVGPPGKREMVRAVKSS